MRIFKKIFACILIINVLFSMNMSYVLADSFDIGNLDGVGNIIREELMSIFNDELGMDSTETSNTMQSLNVSRMKKTPPQVKLTFTPTNPVPGEQVTASATATYFLNDPTDLYYTWYIKHDHCETIDKGDKDYSEQYNSRCDLNEDDDVDIEDYKIEAMRILANGSFDWQSAMGSNAPACSNAALVDKPEYCALENQYSKEGSDDDGYSAVYGGDDQKGKTAYCYIHNYETGDEYEFETCDHLFPNAPGEETGDGTFGKDEEKFWHTDPFSKDTAGTGTLDEATVAGLGKFTFTWNYNTGDKVGVVVEGVSVEPTAYEDSSYKTMWALLENTCDAFTEGLPADSSTVVTGDPTYETSDPIRTVSTTDSETELPISITAMDKHVIVTTTTTTYAEGDYIVSNDTSVGTGPSVIKTVVVETTEKVYPQVISDPFDQSAAAVYSSSSTDTTTSTTETSIEKSLNAGTTVADINTCLEDNLVEPSKGNSDQKITVSLSNSPSAPMNSESGNSSDKLIVRSSISGTEKSDFLNYAWQIYLSSDLAAADEDWKLLTLTELKDQGTDLTKLSGIGLSSIEMKLNFTQDFLTNTAHALTTGQTAFYTKFILRITEGTGEEKKEGAGTLIVPVQLSSNNIKVFSATVADDADLTLSLSTDTERCTTGLDAAICPIVKDEIIGVTIDLEKPEDYDFLWSLDNKILTETADNVAYFPAIDALGSQHTLTLLASHKTTTEKISLIRTFEVVDPAITITSKDFDSCAPKLLGYYIDPINENPNPDPGTNKSAWPDLSDTDFEALSGETVQLKPSFNTTIPENKAWFIDGVQVTQDNMNSLGITEIKTNDTIIFKADKEIGETYSITFATLYTQSNLVKKALNAKWKVAQTSFYEKLTSKSITVKVADTLSSSGVSSLQAKTPQQKVLASLFSAIPSYLNFLFRVALTMLLILFLVRTLFTLFPKQNQA